MRAIFTIACVMIKELIRKKDFYVLLIFLLTLLIFLSSQSFFQIEGINRYIRDFGYSLLMFFSFIIAVTFTAKQIPAEIENRTIYPLLAKPLSRYAVVLGKCLGGIIVSVISFTVFYILYMNFYMIGGTTDTWILVGQGYLFGVLFLCMVSSLVVFLSNAMTVSANITLMFLLYIGIGTLAEPLRDLILLSKGAGALLYGAMYYVLPHFEFFDLRIRITHAWDPLPMWVVFAVIGYAVIYSTALLCSAGYMFNKKRL